MKMADTTLALSVFYSYAHEDKDLRDELDKHLSALKRLEWIRSWHDRDIQAGTEWEREIDIHLSRAQIILLLVSPDFIDSEYCYGLEMSEALKRHATGEAVVIPILLRPVDWHGTPISKLQMLPPGGMPVTSWLNRDEALKQVAEGVRRVVTALRQPIFIASSPLDQEFVTHLSHDLEKRGLTIRSPHEEQGQNPPDQQNDTHDALRQAIREASAAILVVSPDTRRSHAVKKYHELASTYLREVIAVWAKGDSWETSVPDGWETKEYIDAREERYQTAVQEIMRARRSIVLTEDNFRGPKIVAPSVEPPRNPYKGLRAFRSKDTRDFFGRDQLVDQMVKVVRGLLIAEQSGKSCARLLTVIGPSGSGKSSTIMAGLLPKLQQGALPDSQKWAYLEPIVPGQHPIEALALTLKPHFLQMGFKTLREDLEDDATRGLHLLATQLIKGSETRVVLMIDQFEELFTQTISENERRCFIDLLLTAVTEPSGPVLVLLTLRADFYDRPLHYPALGRLIEDQHLTVLPMELYELRDVIEQPAALADVQLTFDRNLVGDLLFETQEQPGALPLLEFTLDELFHRRKGRVLTLEAYQEIGGLKGALTRHAESTYVALPSPEHQRLARALFLRLIDPGKSEQDTTRRRADLSELVPPAGKYPVTPQAVADIFINARLLTANEIAGNTTIEVSHEALIRKWPRLIGWLSEGREDTKLQQALSDDVAVWEQQGKPNDRLYRGSQLKEARAWVKRNVPSNKEVTFLQASATHQMRSRATITALVLLLVLALGLVIQIIRTPSPQSTISTIVTNTHDAGPGSLRNVINSAPDKSMITFGPNVGGTIQFTSGDLNISKNLTLLGPGADKLAISSTRSHVIHVDTNVSVSIKNLAFKDSQITFEDTGSLFGSFIYNEGTLTLTNSIVSGNRVSGGSSFVCGGGIYNGGKLSLMNTIVTHNSVSGGSSINICGGGIFNTTLAMLSLTNSTVSDNKASGGTAMFICGGGIYSSGTLFLTNSTVSGNSVSAGGSGSDCSGGIYNEKGVVTLTNSTISGNTTVYDGGGISNQGGQIAITFCTIYGNTALEAGGITTSDTKKSIGSTSVRTSILAGNLAPKDPDVSGNLASLGYNLIGNPSGAMLLGSPTDVIGVPSTALQIDSTLRDNGGLVQPHTWTHALLPGSPAIDLIPSDVCLSFKVLNDQRGEKRPRRKGCDSGAYELA